MTDTPISATTQTPLIQSSATGLSTTAANTIGEDFNSFIRLLTTQVQNQDPLAPLDSTQFVEQLATFSSLEQQVQTNTHLESIAGMIDGLNAALSSEWIGQTVSVQSDWVPYTGEDVRFAFEGVQGADRATLTVSDGTGTPIWFDELSVEEAEGVWRGETTLGSEPILGGAYRLSVELFDGETSLGSQPARVVTTVREILQDEGVVRLGTDAALTPEINDVRIRGEV